jgi:hypothetical protein
MEISQQVSCDKATLWWPALGRHEWTDFSIVAINCYLLLGLLGHFICHPHNNNNNSVQFFIIYVLSQQLQSQLQTQHSADTSNCNMDKLYIKSKTN